MSTSHFENKDPLSHVLQKRAEGSLSVEEAHGTEMPGAYSAGLDAAKDTAIVLLLFATTIAFFGFFSLMPLLAFLAAWIIWKTGRSALLSWNRLERLHRLIEQEKFEVDHHRPQEREELIALYGAKGFEGKLLNDVVDVLMADQDRLLKVMLEEEMGLTLEVHEHPLKEAFGAFLGALAAAAICLSSLLFPYGILFAVFGILALSGFLKARFEKNRKIEATIWNLAIGALSFGTLYFVLKL